MDSPCKCVHTAWSGSRRLPRGRRIFSWPLIGNNNFFNALISPARQKISLTDTSPFLLFTSRDGEGDPSRSNIAPNPVPPASSPSPSTTISSLAIGDSTSSPWLTTTMTSQALWPLISSFPFSSSSSCLQHTHCCPPSTVRSNHIHQVPSPPGRMLTQGFHRCHVEQQNHRCPDASVNRVWINGRGYANGRTVHCWGQKYQNCAWFVGTLSK